MSLQEWGPLGPYLGKHDQCLSVNMHQESQVACFLGSQTLIQNSMEMIARVGTVLEAHPA